MHCKHIIEIQPLTQVNSIILNSLRLRFREICWVKCNFQLWNASAFAVKNKNESETKWVRVYAGTLSISVGSSIEKFMLALCVWAVGACRSLCGGGGLAGSSCALNTANKLGSCLRQTQMWWWWSDETGLMRRVAIVRWDQIGNRSWVVLKRESLVEMCNSWLSAIVDNHPLTFSSVTILIIKMLLVLG